MGEGGGHCRIQVKKIGKRSRGKGSTREDSTGGLKNIDDIRGGLGLLLYHRKKYRATDRSGGLRIVFYIPKSVRQCMGVKSRDFDYPLEGGQGRL